MPEPGVHRGRHDQHVAVLLTEARNHLEHAAHGWSEPPRPAKTAT